LIEPANDERSMYPWPRIVFWETTALCNLECSHCRRTDVPGSAPPDELSTAEAKRVIDEMAGWGRSLLILSGGEPLLRPDIFPLARHAAERGLIVALASNATLIDGSVSREIAECGIQRVSVSLDGADPATHDVFRRQPGAFASAMGGIEALRDAGVPVQINVTVARHNVGQMDEMAKLAKRLGAVALHLFLLVPVGCGVEIAAEQTISAAEYERTLLWLYETEQAEPDLQLKATCAPHYFRVVRQRQAAELRNVALLPSGQRQAAVASAHLGAGSASHAGGAHPDARPGAGAFHAATRGCLAGIGVCFISHIGKVYGCGYMPVEAGDLRLQSFSEVWQGSRLFAELRDFDALEGRCGMCEFKRVCGGCRARAYGVTGNYLAEEPFCSYRPVTGRRE